jgi:hypothetical protein
VTAEALSDGKEDEMGRVERCYCRLPIQAFRLLPYRLRFWILRSRRGVGSVNRYVENHGHYKMEFGEEIMSGAGNGIPTLDCVSTT